MDSDTTTGEVTARFATAHGAQVTVIRPPSSYITSEFWACACGSTGNRSTDANQVRAGANDHARTCLVLPPQPTT